MKTCNIITFTGWRDAKEAAKGTEKDWPKGWRDTWKPGQLAMAKASDRSRTRSTALLTNGLGKGLTHGSVAKTPPANAGDIGDTGLISGLGRSSGAGHGYPFPYSCLENPMDRGTWWTTVHGVAKSQTQLKWLSTHTNIWSTWKTATGVPEYMPLPSLGRGEIRITWWNMNFPVTLSKWSVVFVTPNLAAVWNAACPLVMTDDRRSRNTTGG